MRRFTLRLRASLYRMRAILALLAAWFLVACVCFRAFSRLSWGDALLSALYLEVQPGVFSQGYAFWGQSFTFGILIALLVRENLENYGERCRLMSKHVDHHTIIIGFSRLGQRLVEHCIARGLPYVLIEKNAELVDDLLRRGEPVVVDDAREKDALPAANVAGARALIIASDNIETSLIVTKAARAANPSLKIAARCHNDDLVGVIESLGADHVFSTSLAAFQSLSGLIAP